MKSCMRRKSTEAFLMWYIIEVDTRRANRKEKVSTER